MIHRSITVASIPPVMTTVPAVIRPALHQTLTQAQEVTSLTRDASYNRKFDFQSNHAKVSITVNTDAMCWNIFSLLER